MRHAVVRTPRRPTRGGVREDGALPDHSATRPCGMCRRTWAVRRDGPGALDGADRLGHWEFLAGCPWSDVVRVQRDVTGRGNASAPSGGPGLGRRRATRQVECRAPSAGGTEGAECHLERMDRMLAIAPEPGSARATGERPPASGHRRGRAAIASGQRRWPLAARRSLAGNARPRLARPLEPTHRADGLYDGPSTCPRRVRVARPIRREVSASRRPATAPRSHGAHGRRSVGPPHEPATATGPTCST